MSNTERKERIEFDFDNVMDVISKLLEGTRPTHGEAENARYSLLNLRKYAKENAEPVLSEADKSLLNHLVHGVA